MSLFRAEKLLVSPYPKVEHCLNFSIDYGSFLELSGPSGVGKTTIMRSLCRLRAHQGGTLYFNERAMNEITPCQWRKDIAFLPQRPVMLSGTVAKNLIAAHKKDKPISDALKETLKRLGLNPKRILDQEARLLSGGEAARIALLRALELEPKVLLLDEPTASLDEKNAADFVGFIHEMLIQKAIAVIYIAHDKKPWASLKDDSAISYQELKLEKNEEVEDEDA